MADEEIVELVTQARQILRCRDLADKVADHFLLVPQLLGLLRREVEAGGHIHDDADESEPDEGLHSEPPRQPAAQRTRIAHPQGSRSSST